MPEGHSIRHFANAHDAWFVGNEVEVASPQGRFVEEASVLSGRRLTETSTHGKHLFFHFDDDIVHVHLGMYGWFRFSNTSDVGAIGPNVRMSIITGERASSLSGPTVCKLISHEERLKVISKLGPDPLKIDSDKTAAWDKIAKSNKSIAALLMDQSVIAGIGNVYRAEILFNVRQRPDVSGCDVPASKFEEIWNVAGRMLLAGSRSGTTQVVQRQHMSDDEIVKFGSHTNASYVYKRSGMPCRVCKTPVASCKVDNRVLYWCPLCQA